LFIAIIACYLFALLEWNLHTHSEHWMYLQSVCFPVAVGQIELTWILNGPVGFETM